MSDPIYSKYLIMINADESIIETNSLKEAVKIAQNNKESFFYTRTEVKYE